MGGVMLPSVVRMVPAAWRQGSISISSSATLGAETLLQVGALRRTESNVITAS